MDAKHVVMVLAALACCVSADVTAETPSEWAEANLADVLKVYVHFHTHPELSFEEKETAARIGDEWKSAGFDVTTDVGGHGVVAILRNGDGPVLMLRTDLDALPVTEQTGVLYESKVRVRTAEGVETGVMHACGHDVHMTNLVAVARYLSANRDRWKGTLMLIGQPAEERGAGAKAMLEDGLFERFPKPDFALALHVTPTVAAGKVECRTGYTLANVDSVDVTIHGRGGHGAQPHTTVDPVVVAAQFVVSLQSVVSREIKPIDPAVITVGSIHAGTKHNIISDRCDLQLTVRSYSDEVRSHLLEAIKRKAKAAAAGSNAPEPEIKISEGTPSLFNNEDLTARMVQVFEQAIGPDNVSVGEQSMGGEDFSRYGREGVPILMYRLGSTSERRLEQFRMAGVQPPSLHSAAYYPDIDDTLKTGIITMSSAALDILNPQAQDNQ